MDLTTAPAIITGGASGLGAATARMLARRGAKVALLDLDEERGGRIAEELGGRFFKVDVTNEAQVTDALEQAAKAHGEARICINCAGIAPPAKVVDRDGNPQPLGTFAKLVTINLFGTFNVTARFAARIVDAEADGEGQRGVIVNTASVAAFDGQIGQAAYAASKAGVAGMTLPIAREFARYGIRVMTIAPGIFITPMMEGLPEEAQKSLGQQVPFPSRLGRPDEYALLVQQIIDNPMLNGETIRLDGAIRMAPK